MALAFDRNFSAPYGEAVSLSPSIRRVLANNPGPFTFTGTGTYIVGTHDVAVIDPGPSLLAHIDALKHALTGHRLTHILITHTHADHSPAAKALKQWSGAATYGFGPHPSPPDCGPRVEEGGDRDFVPDIRIEDGDAIAIGGATFDCLHTPGHISNHICYALREENALFCGDHVMGWSTSVVTPPDGNMTDYMNGLRRLMARDDRTLYPTHGGPIENPKPFLEAYLSHRQEREAQIVECLRAGISTIPAIVARLYAEVDERLHPAAARTVEAHLIKLEGEGRLRSENDGAHYILT